MTDQTPKTNSSSVWRTILWSLIAVYTFLIPNAIYIYRAIEEKYGLVFAGKIPFVIVLVFGAAYIAYLHFAKLGWKKILYLVPSAVIVLAIFRLEGNPNKHIHIPEYVVLAWLVYAALSRDYRDRGMLILVFILTSLLGVVDELEQGIHPGRSYGWSDMLVNSASAMIGVFTILGLTNFNKIGGGWVRNLKKYAGLLWFVLIGIIGAVLMCINLFAVQAQEGSFHGVYPDWLVVWSVFFVLNAPLFLYTQRRLNFSAAIDAEDNENSIMGYQTHTADLWVYPLYYIVLYIHCLLVFVSISGVIFK